MDWLLRRQKRIERTLAARHIEDGSLVLCDLTSVYFEGSKYPLAKRGYSRDGRRGKLQIVFALLCDWEGCPVAAEIFEGTPPIPVRWPPRSRSSPRASCCPASCWSGTGGC